MPNYRFRAVNQHGHILHGTMSCGHADELTNRLAGLGYEPLTYRPQWGQFQLWRAKPSAKQIQLFFTHLAALAAAGVPVVECLADCAASVADDRVRDAVQNIIRQMQQGDDCGIAFAQQHRVFSRSLIAILQAGLASGSPALAFAKARDHAAWQQTIQLKLRRAVRYPLFLLALTIAAMSFMMLYVVPQLIEFLHAQNYALAWHSRALIWLANHTQMLWWLLPLLGVVVLACARYARQHYARFRQWSDHIIIRLPWVGELVQQRELAAYLHHLAILTAGGVPIVTALQTARNSLQNSALGAQADAMLARLMAGAELATAWRETIFLSGVVTRRLQIGLQTGTLPSQLQEASAECDAAILSRSQELINALEPALTLLVGLMLAWIVAAIMGPLYSALGNLQLN